MKSLSILFFLLTSATWLFSQDSAKLPVCYLQILNGISPGSVDFYANDKVLFSNASPGSRISPIGLDSLNGDLLLVHKESGKDLKLPFSFKNGSYNTLLVGGDFLPKSDAEPNPRVYHKFIENNFSENGDQVRVTILNGLPVSSVFVFSPIAGKTKLDSLSSIQINERGIDLVLSYDWEGKTRKLYLGQKGIFRNIALVFYPTPSGIAYKAMTEQTPTAAAAEEKASGSSTPESTESQE